ncbi:MAG: ABC transporter ATP-binding protein [Ruthenibacterium sp.]
MNETAVLQLVHFSSGYRGKMMVKNVDIQIEQGTLTALLGPNGSGKTTLMKGICGLTQSEGTCLLAGKDTQTLHEKERARVMSYLPQHSGVAFSISVLEMVLMGFNPSLRLLAVPNAAQRATALKMLDAVGLASRSEDDFLTLSGGQRQLVLLARALVQDTALLLFDEPDSALDFNNKHLILTKIRQVIHAQNKAGLLCLHDANVAMQYCDRLLLLKDGRLVGTVNPKTDSLQQVQMQLQKIYDDVTVFAADGDLVMRRQECKEKYACE